MPFELILHVLSLFATALCGYLAGRQWRIQQLETKLRAEIYEQAKLDGAFEFIRESLFAGITKR